ncbi:hypothetical protein FQN60_011669 [Etheostoma spectabile]|uniref:D-aminoacyl-tRNA deacylase n=1 Tax=Etheostoma spectabile TaxID=54343 RepID=A0A5J5DMC5_9PERO|nr:hypothetical protein FQN60_011669 [Etheostoma spectabile]
MKAIIQRVTKATVTVGGEEISSIGRGLCVLLGISVEDTQKDADYLVRKILNLRLFEDENGRAWSKSVMDRDFEVLCVSQFTLQCILKANKPDFHSAMPAELAQPFYNSILENMRSTYKPELIKDGKFGAYMQVHIQNDGPVTIELMSPTVQAGEAAAEEREDALQGPLGVEQGKTRFTFPTGPQRQQWSRRGCVIREGDLGQQDVKPGT